MTINIARKVGVFSGRNPYSEISKQCRESSYYGKRTWRYGCAGITGLLPNEIRIGTAGYAAEAEDDVKNGRVAPMQNTFETIRSALRERKT